MDMALENVTVYVAIYCVYDFFFNFFVRALWCNLK